MTDNRNTILAVILSGFVLIAWQYFYGMPAEKARQQTIEQQAAKQSPAPTAPGQAPTAVPGVTPSAPPAVPDPPAPDQFQSAGRAGCIHRSS